MMQREMRLKWRHLLSCFFSRKVRFCKKCKKNAGKHPPGNGRK